MLAADRGYRLELCDSHGHWAIIDGYHRLARHVIERSNEAVLPAILRPRHE